MNFMKKTILTFALAGLCFGSTPVHAGLYENIMGCFFTNLHHQSPERYLASQYAQVVAEQTQEIKNLVVVK